MSRPGSSLSGAAAGTNLTLTQELERLEQSITLTLQEIDHNFSKAHRIVTTSILPLVEQYGEHSKNVWEASKFWKQFFEASANVSLSGYEELAGEGDTTTADETALDESTSEYNTTTQTESVADPSEYQSQHRVVHDGGEDDSLLEDVTITTSTPRVPGSKSKPKIAHFPSPFDDLRRKMRPDAVYKDDLPSTESDDEADNTIQLLSTKLPDMSMTPRSSDVLGDQALSKHKDLLLHRVLDKNYRLQATPHQSALSPIRPRGRSRSPTKAGNHEAEEDRTRRALWADSPMSSPEMAVPKLRSDLYSPVKPRGRSGPRTPGVSVQTPVTSKKRDIFAEVRDDDKGKGKARDEITWSDDDDDDTGMFGGMSPPKTIQFALPPSKLMQTPAREASRRIVDDILVTAGAIPEESEDFSPTMVKMNHDILDDTF
ncbi:DASH complex subunit Ask1-domain-containing protein [Xylariaceae sp. FL1272]|nr:DASH complex subunit Ask1-domain-containing protein [Xylariaceae sp. FL1272]